MSKRKTSINIDDKLWRNLAKFVIDKTGSSRKTSEMLEKAIEEYMEKHPILKNNDKSVEV